jgi:hypothetical protein
MWNVSGDVKIAIAIAIYVQNMRQDVAMILYENTTIATKPISGPLLEGERRTRSHRGKAPYDFDTGILQ